MHVDHVGWPALPAGVAARLSVDGGNPIDGLDPARVSLCGAAPESTYPGLISRKALSRNFVRYSRKAGCILGDSILSVISGSTSSGSCGIGEKVARGVAACHRRWVTSYGSVD